MDATTAAATRPPPAPPGGDRGGDDREKTTPFLRQLTDMLQNNEALISFVPGRESPAFVCATRRHAVVTDPRPVLILPPLPLRPERLPHKITLAKIVIHDRVRVQAEVLPVYFNHASFASLRRQLSYFSFVRVGKSRRSGVTYTHDAVVDLADIRRLRRQASGPRRPPPARPPKEEGAAGSRPPPVAGRGVAGPPRAPGHPPAAPSVSPPAGVRRPPPPRGPPAAGAAPEEVASAVRSGTRHAAETNHDLDVGRAAPAPEGGGAPFLRSLSEGTDPVAPVANPGVDPVVDPAVDPVVNRADAGSRGRLPLRRNSAASTHPLLTKECARLARLVSNNALVPFVHLPVRRRAPAASSGDPSPASSDVTEPQLEGVDVLRRNEPLRDENRIMNACAVNALLALGTAK